MDYKNNEKWLPIKNYEGLYEISNIGRFRTYYNKSGKKINEYTRLIIPYINRYGYERIMLYAKHKGLKPSNRAVCRTVLETFVGNCPNGMEASHLDGIRSNDKLENLIWETHLENERRKSIHGTRPHGKRRIKPIDGIIQEIKAIYKQGIYTRQELSVKYKLSEGMVFNIVQNRL